MTLEADYTGPKVRVPTPATLFGAIDNELREKAGFTRDRLVRSMRDEIPKRSGRTAGDLTGRVVASKGGFEIRVENKRTAHHLRMLQGGTGERGPRGRRIPLERRGVIMTGGFRGRPSGRGMKPQDTLRKMLKAPWREVMPRTLEDMRNAWETATDKLAKGPR